MIDRHPDSDIADVHDELRRYEAMTQRSPWEGESPISSAEVDAMIASVNGRLAERASPVRGSSRVRTFAVAACAILAASVLWLTGGSKPLVAAGVDGELRVLTPQPRAGGRVDVEYVAPATLARETRLHLRALLRRPWDQPYADATVYQRVARLERGRDGRFRGSFVLPDSTVYAALAVENDEASRVDSRGGKRWEVLAFGDSGRIAWEAYQQKINELHGRDSEAALATARERAAAYRSDPRAWGYVRYLEQVNLTGAAQSLVPQHRARMIELHRQFSTVPNPSNGLIEAMRGYLVQLDRRNDSTLRQIGTYWQDARARRMAAVLTAAPSDVVHTDPTAAEWMMWELNRYAMSSADSARPALERFEALAARLPRETEVARTVGYQLARNSGDHAAWLRWADRRSASMPNRADVWYPELLQVDSLRHPVIARLAGIAEKLLRPDDSRRPLELTRAEAARADSAQALRVLAHAARGLELVNDTTGALRVLDRAASIGWDHRVAMRRATLRLALGDTAGAVDPLAQVVADPTTSPAQADSLSRLVAGVGAQRWRAAKTSAERALRAYYLRDATREVLPESVTVSDASGRPVSLQALANGTRTVVLFWSPLCPFSREELRKVRPLLESLRREGARLVIVSDGPRGAETDSVANGLDLGGASYYDAQGDAGRAFRIWSIPNYAVLDASGVLRFSNSSANRVVAQVASLRDER